MIETYKLIKRTETTKNLATPGNPRHYCDYSIGDGDSLRNSAMASQDRPKDGDRRFSIPIKKLCSAQHWQN